MKPYISIILPAYNESGRLPAALDVIFPYMRYMHVGHEIIVVENGSTDDTYQIAESYQRKHPTVFPLRSRPGKGAAVRVGMLFASGYYRYMCDVDLSTPIDMLPRFVSLAQTGSPVVIGSREAPGSIRYNEPGKRHTMGRMFNRAAQSLLISGIRDSQCGFKLFRWDIAEQLFGLQTVSGFAFDVEILYLARQMGIRIAELGVPWLYNDDSRVRPVRDALRMAWDVLKIKFRALSGAYDPKKVPEMAPVRFT